MMERLIRFTGIALVLTAALAGCKAQPPAADKTAGPGSAAPPAAAVTSAKYDDLVALFREWRAFLRPKRIDGAPDFSPAAVREQRAGLQVMKARLAAIDPSGWPVSQRIDYLLVKAELNGLEFNHRVIRPWTRDPGFYAVFEQFQPTNGGIVDIEGPPFPEDKLDALRTELRAVPKALEAARANLTEPASDLALLAVDFKKSESARLAKMAEDLGPAHPDLAADARQAREAVDAYAGWLKASLANWPRHAGVGIEDYNWFIKNVYYLPYTWSDLIAIAHRELERAVSSMALEAHRNRALPPLPVRSDGDLVRFYNESQKYLLDFLRTGEVMTIPGSMTLKPIKEFHAGPELDYFAQVQVRDPLPLMSHDFVGHTPDMILKDKDPRPIRGGPYPPFHIEGVRMEALATGSEEFLMHAGLLDKRPRSRELTYNLLAFRAARAIADLEMHANAMTFREAFDFVVRATPNGWVPPTSPVLWGDLDLYLRQPCYGVGYLIGSVQIQQLMADRVMQRGGKFTLKGFMDEFLASGIIPISLIRWEMTGLDDQVREFWR